MCIYCALLNWEVCWFFYPIFRKSYLDLIISCWLCFSFTFYFPHPPTFFFFFLWVGVCVCVCVVVVMVCFSVLLLSSNHATSYMLNFEGILRKEKDILIKDILYLWVYLWNLLICIHVTESWYPLMYKLKRDLTLAWRNRKLIHT